MNSAFLWITHCVGLFCSTSRLARFALSRVIIRSLFLSSVLLLFACGKNAQQEGASFLIINMSLPRTATTSFAGIFARYNSTHEFMISETVNSLIDYREGKIPAQRLRHFLKERQLRAGHRVDSASFFFLAPEVVYDTFPDAKFFLAVRACESWVVSMVDNSVFAHKMIREGKTTVDLSFLPRYSEFFIRNHKDVSFQEIPQLRRDAQHVVQELAHFWGKTSLQLLDSMLQLPRHRRLIIHMEDFNGSTDAFARLAGIPASGLQLQNQHLNRDRAMDYYREILGKKNLEAACSPQQQKVDAWFLAHAAEVN